jgi:peptidoglycan/xylan/chitin deacetylase (PgdA/CDA1 family)
MSLLLAVVVALIVSTEAPASAAPVGLTVALTFDDGPSPYTPAILAVLRRYGVPATFCMLGDEAQRYPAEATRRTGPVHRRRRSPPGSSGTSGRAPSY